MLHNIIASKTEYINSEIKKAEEVIANLRAERESFIAATVDLARDIPDLEMKFRKAGLILNADAIESIKVFDDHTKIDLYMSLAPKFKKFTFSHYTKSGSSSNMTAMERRCQKISEIVNCQRYKCNVNQFSLEIDGGVDNDNGKVIVTLIKQNKWC